MHTFIDGNFAPTRISAAAAAAAAAAVVVTAAAAAAATAAAAAIATSTAAASSPAVAAAVAKPAQWQPPQQQQFSTALGFTEAPRVFSPQSARVQSYNVKPEALRRHSSPQTHVSKCHYDNLPSVSPTSIRLGPTGAGVTEHARASCTGNVQTKNSQTKNL